MMLATLKRLIPLFVVLTGLFWAPLAFADLPGIPAFTVQPGEGEGVEEYTVTLQILALMTALTFLPAMLMMMTSFTRIIVVFAICARHWACRPRLQTRYCSAWPCFSVFLS